MVYETDRATVQLSLHNGTGAWDRLFGNFRSDVTDPTDGGDGVGMAGGVYAAYRPLTLAGFELGGYVGYNAAEHRP